MNFQVVIEEDESGYFVVEVPALSGCFSLEKSIEEASVNIKEAIIGWLSVMNDRAKKSKMRTIEVAV
ncbi:MAG: type II toxin-antitoxin system HicB family antitoxin [Ignavibacteria bacterium]|nr:type II toxin-antitoxin system HicB family antitoxin [Ignavibacteria bacterium]